MLGTFIKMLDSHEVSQQLGTKRCLHALNSIKVGTTMVLTEAWLDFWWLQVPSGHFILSHSLTKEYECVDLHCDFLGRYNWRGQVEFLEL